MKMNGIVLKVKIEENIRHTEDGEWWSVYDVIRFVCGTPVRNRSLLFKRITATYSEVFSKVRRLQFPGKGQRHTPVMNERGILELIMLLPGIKAAKYRKDFADILVRYFEGDKQIAADVIDKQTNPLDKLWIANRAIFSATNHLFMDEMKKRGGLGRELYRNCNGIIGKATTATYPNILTNCQTKLFPGKWQKKTPAMTKQGILKLITMAR